MELVRAARLRSLREDVPAFAPEVAPIAVATDLQSTSPLRERRGVYERNSDVEDRFRGESRDRGAPDVLDAGREIAQRPPKEQLLVTELVRPPRVVFANDGRATTQPERRVVRAHSRRLLAARR